MRAGYVTVSLYGQGCGSSQGSKRRASLLGGWRKGRCCVTAVAERTPGSSSQASFQRLLSDQNASRSLVFCTLTVGYQSFFRRHSSFSRTHFPPPHIRTNIDSAVVCCSLRLYLALRRPGPFETCRKWSFSPCQREVSVVAVGAAIQPGETESVGTPQDVLSSLDVCLLLAV